VTADPYRSQLPSGCAYSPARGGLIQARHLHVTVSQGFGGGPRSISQACLHLHRTFITERQTGQLLRSYQQLPSGGPRGLNGVARTGDRAHFAASECCEAVSMVKSADSCELAGRRAITRLPPRTDCSSRFSLPSSMPTSSLLRRSRAGSTTHKSSETVLKTTPNALGNAIK